MTNSLTPSGTGIVDAANQIEAILAGNEKPVNQTPAPEKAAIVEDSDSDSEPLEATETEDETPPEDSQEETEGAEDEEAAADAEESDEETSDEIQLVTVKINGKEEQIPLEEAIKGYQRHADYSRKMNEVSESRKTLEAELAEVQTERAQYAQLLEALSSQLTQGTEREPDWEALYNENPLEYVRQKDLWRDRKERLEAVSAEQQRLNQIQAAEQQAAIQALVQENRAKLLQAIPEWKDSKRWEQDRTAIRAYGNKLGFTDEEIAQAYDHRAIVALYKAMKYDSIMAKRPQPSQKSNAPKVASAGTPANAPPTKTKSAVTNAKQRLAKSGRLSDAASLFEKLI